MRTTRSATLPPIFYNDDIAGMNPRHCERWAGLAISHNEIYSWIVHVITRKRLWEFAKKHKEAEEPLNTWYAIMSKTDFRSFAELKRAFGSVDKVEKFTVFDIGGNKFRLIAVFHYNRQKVYIRHVLTHAEYDRGKWKD